MHSIQETRHLAQNLARNCGYAVFPCAANKEPARPEREGGHGYLDATTDPEMIAWLWRHWPGPLIGIATGERSRVDVADVDAKQQGARAWWHQNQHRLPSTATYRTRGGGLHLHYQHALGVRCSRGKPVPGIDVRGDGGYVISWFAAGLECLDHTQPAPWPAWLIDAIWPPAQPTSAAFVPGTCHADAVIRTVAQAAEGTRNGKLFWAANRLRERGLSRAAAERELVTAAIRAGLPELEARRTVRSAYGRAA